VRGSHWVGKKNPDYWDKGKPYLDGYRAALRRGREILLDAVALLDTMTAGLVDDMLERSDAHQLFERFEHESMFLVALDAHRECFRFHHLFARILRVELENAGDTPWRDDRFTVSYHWLDELGNAIVWDGLRTPLPAPVAPVKLPRRCSSR
jgi:hypothetical protein